MTRLIEIWNLVCTVNERITVESLAEHFRELIQKEF